MKRTHSILTALTLSALLVAFIGFSLTSTSFAQSVEPPIVITFPNAPDVDPSGGGEVAISKNSEMADDMLTYTLSITNTGTEALDILVLDNFPEGYIPTACSVTLYDPSGAVYGPFAVQPKQDFHPTTENVPAGASYDLICSGPIMSFIDVSKTPDVQEILNGGDAEFTVTVTNTGDVTLTDVTTIDAMVPACNATVSMLAPGEAVTYTCTDPMPSSTYTNTISAAGTATLVNVATANPVSSTNIAVSNTVTDTFSPEDSDTALVIVPELTNATLSSMNTDAPQLSSTLTTLAVLVALIGATVVVSISFNKES